MDSTKVLFLCTANSARSQIAEALLRHHGKDRFQAYSAGIKSTGINPYTLQVMNEIGIDMKDQYSKSLDTYLGREHFQYVITVCARAEEQCPTVFPGMGKRLHWAFDDPASLVGNEEEKLSKFREIRDQIQEKILHWVNTLS